MVTLPRVGYSPSEFAAMTSMSKSAVYAAVDRGDIKARRIGSRLIIPVAEVSRLLGPDSGGTEGER